MLPTGMRILVCTEPQDMRRSFVDQIERGCVKPLQVVQEERQRMLGAREHADEAAEDELEAPLRALGGKLGQLRGRLPEQARLDFARLPIGGDGRAPTDQRSQRQSEAKGGDPGCRRRGARRVRRQAILELHLRAYADARAFPDSPLATRTGGRREAERMQVRDVTVEVHVEQSDARAERSAPVAGAKRRFRGEPFYVPALQLRESIAELLRRPYYIGKEMNPNGDRRLVCAHMHREVEPCRGD
jgi:hypothetical protein